MPSPVQAPPYREPTTHEVPPPADPMAYIKQKLANGDSLTPSESKAVLNSGLSSTQLAAPAAAPKIRNYTPPTPVEVTAHPVGTPRNYTPKPEFKSNPYSVTQLAGYSVPYTPKGGSVAPPVMEVAPKAIPTVAKAAPVQAQGPVSSALAQAAPEAAGALEAPIPAMEASQKLDAFQKFLK